jgi:hypothetical protein
MAGRDDDDDVPGGGGGRRPAAGDDDGREDDRLGAGFDFLLYQKKAGLQQIAEEATKEEAAKEEDKGMDAGPVQQVKQRTAKLDKRRPPGPMYLSWKQMEDEENERLKQAGKGDLPCKDDVSAF